MWNEIKVKMEFEEKLCGSVPQSKELVSAWLNARKPKTKPKDAKPLEEIEQEVLDSIQDAEERTTLSFERNDRGFFVRGGTIKAHLKDCANQIKDVVGVKAFRSKIANKIHVLEYHIYLHKNGSCVMESDGSFEQPVHVMTPLGPRNALKVIHYVEQATLEFTLKLLEDKEVKPGRIEKLFEYGSIHGYGGERGMGEGRYRYTLDVEL